MAPAFASEEILRLDVGSLSAEPSLGFGWSRRERDKNRTFQWICRAEADVFFEWKGRPGNVVLELVAAPLYMPWRRQKIGVTLNNRFVGEILCELSPDFKAYVLPIPADAWRAGRNRLILRMGYWEQLGRDSRELALAVDTLIFREQ